MEFDARGIQIGLLGKHLGKPIKWVNISDNIQKLHVYQNKYPVPLKTLYFISINVHSLISYVIGFFHIRSFPYLYVISV